MHTKQKNSRALILSRLCHLAAIAALVTSCSGRRADMETSGVPEEENKDKKIENMTSALSRAQNRIEELDAKLSALSDKVETTRVLLDNVAGNKPIKTETVGAARADATNDEDEDEKAPESPKASAKAAHGEKPSFRMDTATNEFAKALALFKAGKYSDAELGFNHITEKFPEHVVAGSAQYYAGESYYLMGEYKLALNEFTKVVSTFASSPRVSTAMVRMSHCYEAIGNQTEAARTMALARDLYSGNPSLDLPPALAKKDSHQSGRKIDSLNIAPIEPIAVAKAEDDQKIDNLEEENDEPVKKTNAHHK